MSVLPVRPSLDALQGEVDRLIDAGVPEDAARSAVARAYQAGEWHRLEQACALADAIWENDSDAVRVLMTVHPELIAAPVLIRPDSHWGPPLTYAANLGRDGIIRLLRQMGARDFATAFDRAALQGQVDTAAMLHEWMGRPAPPVDALGGPAYTLSASGTAFVLKVMGGLPAGARAPVDVVLETDSRKPTEKHAILEAYVAHGVALPDTPPMAVHRGRIDLLEAHLARDPGFLTRTFTHDEIFPPVLGCHDAVLATHGTPLDGATLLHMAVDYDELDIARWLLEKGMPVDTPAAVDADGFGGHTALFAAVVSQPAFWINRSAKPDEAPMARLLLAHGANPRARASLRKQLHPGYGAGERLHEYPDVTPLEWGRRFHRQEFVSQGALRLIAAAAIGD